MRGRGVEPVGAASVIRSKVFRSNAIMSGVLSVLLLLLFKINVKVMFWLLKCFDKSFVSMFHFVDYSSRVADLLVAVY